MMRVLQRRVRMIKVSRIQINYLDHITGVTESPRFSWVIDSPFKNCVQLGYQLQIAIDPGFKTIDMDSGMVESDQSAQVVVKNFIPEEGVKYHVRVRVHVTCDGLGEYTTAYGKTAATMLGGLKNPDELKNHFITAEEEKDIPLSKGTYLRKEFTIKKEIQSAIIYSTAFGMYQLHLNGELVSDDQLAPGWTSYGHRVLYQTYDVSHLLNKGANALGAHLGPGWYKGTLSFLRIHHFYGPYTALSLRLDVVYTDGTKESFYSDDSWKGSDSPVVLSELYDGESYDARLEQPGWDAPDFNDDGWRCARFVESTATSIEPQYGSAVKKNEQVSPKLAFVTPKGERVIDFGQNMSALPMITGQGKAGDRVVITCFEVLDKDGNVYTANLRKAAQTVTYTIKDDKSFTFTPHFTFFGFRFIHVSEFPGRADLDNFLAFAVYSEMEQTGFFECSNPDLNQLQSNIQWGMKSNFVSVPTDCPQRDERMGWTGDAQIFGRTAAFNMNTYTFFSNWLRDLAVDQKAVDGGVPHVIPDVLHIYPFKNWLLEQGSHSAAAWSDAAVINPWVLYLAHGDAKILEVQYESMKAWIDFMTDHAEGNIWSYRLQFGDWVALDAEEGSYFGATPTDLISTAYYEYSTRLFSKVANILGRDEDAKRYALLADSIKRTFQETFFNENGDMTAQTQTAHILALHFNLTPEKHLAQTVVGLKHLLDKHDGHLVTGFVGTPYFCHALSSNGCMEEAYDLLLKTDFPSWLYQVKKGATTIWEHWDGIKPDGSMWSPGMNSFNHYAYGAIGEWLYQVVAGLEIDEENPGYKHTIIEPGIGGRLHWVKCSYVSTYGTVGVHWEVEGKTVSLTVTIPGNTTATIRLSDAREVLEQDGLNFTYQDGAFTTQTGSGTYAFTYLLN